MTSRARLLLPLLCVLCIARTVPASRAKPFWHDEIYTILMSRLPSLHAMWSAGADGVDLSPPLNLWATRAVHAVAGVGVVQTRVPALAGFCLAVCLIFLVVVRRAGMLAALSGALIPFVTAGLRFASEARPYGLMMGLAAASLYCWMEAARGRARTRNLALLALALAASIWNHYFGLLVFAPIAAGECVRTADRRQIDRGVALAMLTALIMTLPLYRLATASLSQRGTFWSHVTSGQVPETYAFILNALLSAPALGVAVTVTVLLIAARVRAKPGGLGARQIPRYEAAALITAIAIPLLGIVLSRVAVSVFVPRYALAAVPGLSMAIPIAVWRLNAGRSGAELCLCAALATVVLVETSSAIRHGGAKPPNPLDGRPLLLESLHSASPTVVSSSLQFVQFWYYLPPELKPRLRYLADPARALQRTGADTIDRGYLALSRWAPVSVDTLEGFVDRERSFRVYQAGSGWLLDELAERGATITEIGRESAGRLLQVTMPVR